ncbi:unnamed protein product [Strongylus vulgaris]|uniref:Uncharacterized protein n=1 Tax=Strongylus vulgaris TaxID=40348 RepID=A0A3P7LL02_STRVU|nr:unnamed protein product [Strongylus vulgaris]
MTPLHKALLHGQTNTVRHLLAKYPQCVNATDHKAEFIINCPKCEICNKVGLSKKVCRGLLITVCLLICNFPAGYTVYPLNDVQNSEIMH